MHARVIFRWWQTVCLAAHEQLVTSLSWKELCPTPKVLYVCRRATAVTSRLSLGSQAIFMFVVCANFVGKKKEKKLTKNSYHKKLLNLSRTILLQKTGYEAATGIVRLLSKASDTGSSRHIKTGCHLPVCITRADRKQAANWNGRLVGVGWHADGQVLQSRWGQRGHGEWAIQVESS